MVDKTDREKQKFLEKFGEDKYIDLLLSGGIRPEDLPPDLMGNPVHIPQVNFDVPMEQKIRARMGPPSYAVRARYVEDLEEELHQELERKWKMVADNYQHDPDKFNTLWRVIVETLDLEHINQLIKEHNRYYPIEANLREDPDTGRLMMGNTPWKPKKKITPERLLEKFPPDINKALGEEEE
ncbi:MAG: hypothetical protein R6V10_08210 [bacterium]